MLSIYRGIRPRAGCVCVCAVRAIFVASFGSPLLPVRTLVHMQAQRGSFLQVVMAVSSKARKR